MIKNTTTEHEELLTFAKVTESLRRKSPPVLDTPQARAKAADDMQSSDPAIQAEIDWMDTKQSVQCALCDLNDALERDMNGLPHEIVSALWDCRDYFGCDLNLRH